MATVKECESLQGDSNHCIEFNTDHIAKINLCNGYIDNIDHIRSTEYSTVKDIAYLDHAGTTPYARSLIEAYTADLTANLFGNPHSASASSQLSTQRIDDVRLQVLRFFNAEPEHFDVVFVANATAAIKLVADAFRDQDGGFHLGYHRDSHTSLVGVREVASQGSVCFEDDNDVRSWIESLQSGPPKSNKLGLLAYPGQSNMTGHRQSFFWCSQVRAATTVQQQSYSLYDAAALSSTFAIDLKDPEQAPDFIALSFYKIFGFPDLGALIVRKASGAILQTRRYFGGGSVDMTTTGGEPWHAKKKDLHASLEDGTLPFHNIIALEHAIRIHIKLFGSMTNISRHTRYLAQTLYTRLSTLKHWNTRPVSKIYSEAPEITSSGPIVTFNLLDENGRWVSNAEVEKLAIIKGIQFRTGSLCNPGGIAKYLHLTDAEMKQNYATGQRCGQGEDIKNDRPTGAIRISLGATSNLSDIEKFIAFLKEFYVESKPSVARPYENAAPQERRYHVESLSVFPVKSCAAFKIPLDIDWEILPKGLAFDREWCIVHQGTNIALSQKQYPAMATIQPRIDRTHRQLILSYSSSGELKNLTISLDYHPDTQAVFPAGNSFQNQNSIVCGELVPILIYNSHDVSSFFTSALGVPCTLARHPHHSTPRYANIRRPKSHTASRPFPSSVTLPSIKLSNESPILLINRSSVNRLNELIKGSSSSIPSDKAVRTVTADSFRGNIVIAESPAPRSYIHTHQELAYAEDDFTSLTIINNRDGQPGFSSSVHHPRSPPASAQVRTSHFRTLGPCQRCQMVCVDQKSGKRNQEPFSTLAKTRRKDGRVWFGVHLCLDDRYAESGERSESGSDDGGGGGRRQWIRVGDVVVPSYSEDGMEGLEDITSATLEV